MSDLQRTIVQNLLPYAGAGKMKWTFRLWMLSFLVPQERFFSFFLFRFLIFFASFLGSESSFT
jgi:hypothetical protein